MARSSSSLARSAPLAILLAVVTASLACMLGVFVTTTRLVTAAEFAFLDWLSTSHTGIESAVAFAVNTGFGTVGAVIVTVVVAAVAGVIGRSWRDGVVVAVLVAVPWATVEGIKWIVHRPRPDMDALTSVLIDVPNSTSFPSGHTAFATALGCAVVWLLVLHRRGRGAVVAAIAVAAALALVAAWSRMYLGVHQPTDVGTSMVLVPMVSWATAGVIATLRERRESDAELV